MKSYYKPNCQIREALNVKVRRKRRWSRFVVAVIFPVFVASPVGLLSFTGATFGSGWLRERVADSSFFVLENVLVLGTRSLSVPETLRIAGVRRGENLFTLDLVAIRSRLVAHPFIRTASVRRRLPVSLLLEIEERVPVAVVRAGRDYLVDREGEVLTYLRGERPATFPLLLGVEVSGGRLTARGAERFGVGLSLTAALRSVAHPPWEAIGHLDLTDEKDAVLVPVGGRPLVHLGKGNFASRLGRWKAVARDLAGRWSAVTYIDLRAEGQVVARPVAPAPTDAGTGEGEGG
jgi:cell division protein FtsQ